MQQLSIGGLNIQVPIIQGGMGVGISLNGLASAVANEGGVGVISSAGLGLLYRHLSKDYLEASILGLREEIRKAREKTKGIIGINIMVALTNFEDMVRTSIEEKVDMIIAGAGLPLDLPKYLNKESITKLVPIVSSGRAAKIICEKWKSLYNYLPDAIVVEGPKAGGHLGFKVNQLTDGNFKLEELIPEVVKEVAVFEKEYNQEIPVIAAGGIYDGKDIYNIMQLGAKGVQMGTQFVTTEECDASIEFKHTYIQATETDVEIIQSPVGMPGRAINNEFLEAVKRGEKKPINCPVKCIKTCNVDTTPYCIISALMNAYKGNFKAGYAFAGSNAYRATRIKTVKELMNELVEGLKSSYEKHQELEFA
ncbi:MAG: nitronate monooxygenase [Chitinophagaceae bacterium]|nr:nitronate monooxygenase [Chitinophagaceae bacterium]